MIHIMSFIRRHPTIVVISLPFVFYYLYIFWYDGYFAITREDKLRAEARRSVYYEDNLPNIPFPLYPYPKWHHDPNVIPTAKAFGDKLIPYLAEELTLPIKENLGRVFAARFVLAEAIRSTAALDALINTGDMRGGTTSTIAKLIGPAALACTVPVDSLINFIELEVNNENRKQEIRKWYTEYKHRVRNTDYGIGIVMPDDTIRPLGFHGVQTYNSALQTTHYFCTVREIVYGSRTFVRNELGNIINMKSPRRLSDSDLEIAGRAEFQRLFEERVAADTTFWPYYPIFSKLSSDFYTILGYHDKDHLRHGPWRNMEASYFDDKWWFLYGGEQWYFHGEEVNKEEYYQRGGYEMDISLCEVCPSQPEDQKDENRP